MSAFWYRHPLPPKITRILLTHKLVSLPELIAQTNMDHQSVSKLRDEMAKLTQWLGKNSNRFFTAEYETASQEYVEKSKGSN